MIKTLACLLCALSLLSAFADAAIASTPKQSADTKAAADAINDGERLLRKGKYIEAIDAFKKALSIKPDLFEANYGLGNAYKALGRHDEAVGPLSSAIRLRPNFSPAYYALGEAYFRLVRYELAIEALKKAISLKLKNPRAFSLLGYASYKLGRWDEAISAYKEFIKLTKDNTSWERRLIGWFNLYLSRGEEAASQAINNLKKDGWQATTALYDVLTAYWGYMQSGRAADARKILDEAAAKVNHTEWPYPVIQYLRREITADKLLDIIGGGVPSFIAIDNGKMIVARAHIGMELSLSGRREDALLHLRWVRDNGKKEAAEYEYLLAISELSRIEK